MAFQRDTDHDQGPVDHPGRRRDPVSAMDDLLSLPVHPDLTDNEVDRVIDAVPAVV